MSIDRDSTVRRAEKLLREGRLEAAIAEYQALADDQPADWNSANALGDLLVRAGRVDKAVMQYFRIADNLAREGFLPKAAALYKKILKLTPDDEEAALRAAEISLKQGLILAAKGYLGLVIDRRRARGDVRGAAELMVRLGALDPADTTARTVAARALGQAGDGRGAATQLCELGHQMVADGQEDEGLTLLREAAGLDPGNDEIRTLLVRTALARHDIQGVLTYARTTTHLKDAAVELLSSGDVASSLEVLCRANELEPGDPQLHALLARGYARQGDIQKADDYLGPGAAGHDDPESQLARAEVQCRSGRVADARNTLRALLTRTPEARTRAVELALDLAADVPDAALQCAEAVVSGDLLADLSHEAADTLERLLERAPGHVPTLMRLVEVCVEGDLGARAVQGARERLADAYLAAGRGLEGRVIAEDLVTGAPWERVQVERLRRALTLLGEADPDRAIADKLADSPRGIGQRQAPEPEVPASTSFELGPNAIDVHALLREVETSENAALFDEVEIVEVDLSGAMEDASLGSGASRGAAMSASSPRDLEGVFDDFRQEVSRESANEEAEQQYKLALTYRDMGLIDDALVSLERAARSPRRRFAAASLLARLHLSRNKLTQAIEWFERAAEAPASATDESRALLYELATTLERSGEDARALAVYLELRADAGEYRDVSQRIGRLTDLQAKG